jgi:hypothetical protein
MRILPAVLSVGLICLPAVADEPRFVGAPSARAVGDAVEIRFAVSGATDVEVAILDGAGKVVRHLAAGVLGGKTPPPPPLKPGLAQELVWDGKDDAGEPAAGGPFRVRVSAGLRPRFDGFLLHNPDACGPVGALAVGPGGQVYVFHHDPTELPSHWGSKKIKILSRDGRHVRALTPFPAEIAPERIRPLAPFRDAEGRIVPHIFNLRHLSVYPDPGGRMPAYSSPAVDARGRVYWLVMGPRLACLDADGGVPYERFIGPPLLADVKDLFMKNIYRYGREGAALAVSGDGKHLYLAGLKVAAAKGDKVGRPLPCVFRVDLATRGGAEVFVGRLDRPGKAEALLTAPGGLAVAGGLLYVADGGADRVAVFKESTREFAGEIAVENPQSIGVDPETGAVYVCAYTGKQTADLIKFDGVKAGREVCRLALPKTGLNPNFGVHRIAVDASARPVRIWMPNLPYSKWRLGCIDDTGEKFEVVGDLRSKAPWAEGPRDLSLDRRRGELYVKVSHQKWYRIDEPTGKVKDVVDLRRVHKYNLHMSDKGTQLVPSPDGSLITLNWNKGIIRLDRSGKPVNFPGRQTDCIPYGGIMSFQERSLAMVRPDELYVILPSHYRAKEKSRFRLTSVDVLGLDGAVRRTAVWQCTQGAILRVDGKGNLYVADAVKPPDRSYPAFFDGKLKAPPTSSQARGDRFWYSYMYGSIVKFPPAGGAIWLDPKRRLSPSVEGQPPEALRSKPEVKVKAHLGYQPHSPAAIQGAAWYRFGFSPFTLTYTGSDTCMCHGAGFDVDAYGRVFYPNVGQFRVEVVDGGNNWIGSFGGYGNPDAAGKGARIPLAWPLTVAVSDTHAYVADTVSRRLARVRLAYAATAICPVQRATREGTR